MDAPTDRVDHYLDALPSVHELRRRLAQNLRERDLLRRLLRLAQHRERLADGSDTTAHVDDDGRH